MLQTPEPAAGGPGQAESDIQVHALYALVSSPHLAHLLSSLGPLWVICKLQQCSLSQGVMSLQWNDLRENTAMDWTFVPPNSYIELQSPGRSCLEVGALGGDYLMREDSLITETRADPCLFSHVRFQWEDSHQCGRGLPPNSRSAGTMVMNFPASRTVGDKYKLFISHPVYGIFCCYEQTKRST